MRVLFLGAGAVVSEFYLPAMARLGTQWKTTVADLSEDALKRVTARAPWVNELRLDYVEALRNSREFDFAVVALPNWLHVAACKIALEYELPVLCEKPLSLSSGECLELAHVAEQCNTPLEVAMVRRLTPANQAAVKVLQSGVLGAVREISIKHGSQYSWVSESGAFFRKENGGILADLGIHHLDWLASIFGPLEAVSYVDDAAGGVEASCSYLLRSGCGVTIDMQLTHRHQLENTTTFRCEKGLLIIDRGNFKSVRISGVTAGTTFEVSCDSPFEDDSLPHTFDSCFVQQLMDFKKVVQGSKAARVTPREAAEATRLIESAYANRLFTSGTALGSQEKNEATCLERPRIEFGSAVVTGATGFIGGHLLERLAEIGFDQLTVPVRNYRTCVNAARFPVKLTRTDLCERSQVRDLLRGARWVFHLAYGQTESDAGRITVDATKLLIEEAVSAKVETVVVLSTMGVFGHPSTDVLVDETFDYSPAYGSYGKTKAKMEQWLLSPDRDFGETRVVVLNPSCVYGPYGKTYSKLPHDLAEVGRFAWIENGRGMANYVYVDNLVDAILLAAGTPSANRKRFLVNDGFCSWHEFLSPLLGKYADNLPSFTLNELRKGTCVDRSSSMDLIKIIARSPEFRKAVGEHRLLGPAKRIASKLGAGRLVASDQSVLLQAKECCEKPLTPEIWLADLFGPTCAKFSSLKLQQLGWRSRINLAVGHEKTVQWLETAVPGFSRA